MFKVSLHSSASKNKWTMSLQQTSPFIFEFELNPEVNNEKHTEFHLKTNKQTNRYLGDQRMEDAWTRLKLLWKRRKIKSIYLLTLQTTKILGDLKLTAHLCTCKSAVQTGPCHLCQPCHQLVSARVLAPVRLPQGCCISTLAEQGLTPYLQSGCSAPRLTQFPSLHVSFVEVATRAHSISQTGNINDTSPWSSGSF